MSPLADEPAFGHYADAVAQNLSLIHIVGGQDDDSLLLLLLQEFPQFVSGNDIQTSGWLVKQDKVIFVANERQSNLQLAFLATREISRLNVFLLCEADIFDELRNFRRQWSV